MFQYIPRRISTRTMIGIAFLLGCSSGPIARTRPDRGDDGTGIATAGPRGTIAPVRTRHRMEDLSWPATPD